MKSIFRPVYHYCLAVIGLLKFTYSFTYYSITGRNTGFALQSNIDSFCFTSGSSSEIASRLISKNIFQASGKFESLVRSLKKDGFFFAPKNSLPITFEPEAFLELAEKTNIVSTSSEGLLQHPFSFGDIKNHQGSRFNFDTKSILNSDLVQKLLGNETLYEIASQYLGTTPYLDIVTMWLNKPSTLGDEDEAALSFHFDMDRIKWVKFFFYITNVEPKNGPHCFVKGSHNSGSIPRSILKKNYARISDQEILQHYKASDIIEFTGKAGDIIIEDTRGLHKGKVVQEGTRLLFQLQFTNSLFGSSHHSNYKMTPSEELKKSKLFLNDGLKYFI